MKFVFLKSNVNMTDRKNFEELSENWSRRNLPSHESTRNQCQNLLSRLATVGEEIN